MQTDQKSSIRQLVKIRFKKLSCGESSVYLDIYYRGHRSYEFIKDTNGKTLRILPETGTPKNQKAIRNHNKRTMLLAEELRLKTERSFFEKGVAEPKPTVAKVELSLKQWIERYKQIMKANGAGTSTQKHFITLVFHLKKWLGEKFESEKLSDICADWCRSFMKYLDNYKRQSVRKKGVVYTLSSNSKSLLAISLRSSFNAAVKEGFLALNYMDELYQNKETPRHEAAHRDFLTFHEVNSCNR